MTPRLQRDINYALSGRNEQLADQVAQAETTLAAIEAAELEIDDTERGFLEGIPTLVWEAMKPTLVAALRGELDGLSVSLADGFHHTLAIAHRGSEAAITLTAPLPEPPSATSD